MDLHVVRCGGGGGRGGPHCRVHTSPGRILGVKIIGYLGNTG